MAAYVLIVLLQVYGGHNGFSQEFANKTACEAAADWVRGQLGDHYGNAVTCMPRATL
jgi:hypothetical protein